MLTRRLRRFAPIRSLRSAWPWNLAIGPRAGCVAPRQKAKCTPWPAALRPRSSRGPDERGEGRCVELRRRRGDQGRGCTRAAIPCAKPRRRAELIPAKASVPYAPHRTSAGLAFGGSGHADTSNPCPARSARVGRRRRDAVRLRKRCGRHRLRRCCDSEGEGSNGDQFQHRFLLLSRSLTWFRINNARDTVDCLNQAYTRAQDLPVIASQVCAQA